MRTNSYSDYSRAYEIGDNVTVTLLADEKRNRAISSTADTISDGRKLLDSYLSIYHPSIYVKRTEEDLTNNNTAYPDALQEAMGLPEDRRESKRGDLYAITDRELLLGAALRTEGEAETAALDQYRKAVGEYTDAKEAMDAATTALKNAKGEARKQPQQEYNAARTREADAGAKVAKLEATDELRKVAKRERKRMEPLSTPVLQQREREYRERLLNAFNRDKYTRAIERTRKSLMQKLITEVKEERVIRS